MPTENFRALLSQSRDRITEMLRPSSPLQDVGQAALQAWGSGGRQSFGELYQASQDRRLQGEVMLGDIARQDAQLSMQEDEAKRAEAQDMIQLAQTLTADAEPGSLQRLLQHWDSLPEDFSAMEPSERITALVGAAEAAGIRPRTERFQSGRHIIERDPATGEYRIVFSTPQDVTPRQPTQAELTARALVATGRAENLDEAMLMASELVPIPGVSSPMFEGTGMEQQSANVMSSVTARMMRGEPLTLEDTLAFNQAYQAVAGTQTIEQADGTVVEMTGAAPVGVPTPQEVAAYTQQAQVAPWTPPAATDGTVVGQQSVRPLPQAAQDQISAGFNTLRALNTMEENVDETGLISGQIAELGVWLGTNERAIDFAVARDRLRLDAQSLIQGIPSNFDVEILTRTLPNLTNSEARNRQIITASRAAYTAFIRDIIAYHEGTGHLIPDVIRQQAADLGITSVEPWDGQGDPLARAAAAAERAASIAEGSATMPTGNEIGGLTLEEWEPAEILEQGAIAQQNPDQGFAILEQLFAARDQLTPQQREALEAALRMNDD